MNSLVKLMSAFATIGMMAVALNTPSFAAPRYHSQVYRGDVGPDQEYGWWGYGNNDYFNGYGAYDYVPGGNIEDTHERNCTLSPGSQNFEP